MSETIQKRLLQNGTRVLLIPKPGARSVMILVLYGVGSRDESEIEAGAAHYSEHMVYRGTKSFRNQTALTRVIEAVGAKWNAFTGEEFTGYYLQLDARRAELAVQMLSELSIHPLFRKKDVDHERGAILQEARKFLDVPSERCDYMLKAMAFPGHPLGRPIIGTTETISAFSRDSLLDFRSAYYVPESAVIAVVGKFDEKELMPMLQAGFGKASPDPSRAEPRLAPDGRIAMPKVDFLAKETVEEASFELGFPAYSRDDDRQDATAILLHVLGVGMSSRLMANLRTKHGLTYGIGAGLESFVDTGVASVSSGVRLEKALMAVQLTIDELLKLKERGITERELADAKGHITGNTAIACEGIPFLAQHYAIQELLCTHKRTIEEELAGIAAVTRGQVLAVARDLFRTSRANLAMVARKANTTKLLKQLERLGD
jgi:predicted Zn-dependent peptidase